MTTENSNPCDPDDVVCQEEKLHRLEILGELVAGDEFLEKYPALEGIRQPLSEDLAEQKKVLQKSIDECAQEGDIEPVSEGVPKAALEEKELPPRPEPEPTPVPATEVGSG